MTKLIKKNLTKNWHTFRQNWKIENLPRTGRLFDKIGKIETYQELASCLTKLEKKLSKKWHTFRQNWKIENLPRTGKRLDEVGCFLPTLDNDLVTGWLDENDVSWKDTSLNLDVVFIFRLSLDSFFIFGV